MGEQDADARLRLLLRLARQVTSRHDLNDVLSETFRGLRSVVDFAGGSIHLLDDEGWIRLAASDPPASADRIDRRIPLGDSVASRVVLSEQPVYVPDAAATADTPTTGAYADGPARSYLAVPLLADGRSIGLLQFEDPRPDAFDDGDRFLLIAASTIVSAAVQNARANVRTIAARARSDTLTRRIEEARHLVETAKHETLVGADSRLARLLAGLEQVLGERAAAVDLREQRIRS